MQTEIRKNRMNKNNPFKICFVDTTSKRSNLLGVLIKNYIFLCKNIKKVY